MDNLKKWHVIVVDKCCMCKIDGEAVEVSCEIANVFWNAFFSRFGLSLVMPSRVIDLFACWWCLWRERNDRNFEDCERILEELKFFFYSLYTTVFVALLVISF